MIFKACRTSFFESFLVVLLGVSFQNSPVPSRLNTFLGSNSSKSPCNTSSFRLSMWLWLISAASPCYVPKTIPYRCLNFSSHRLLSWKSSISIKFATSNASSKSRGPSTHLVCLRTFFNHLIRDFSKFSCFPFDNRALLDWAPSPIACKVSSLWLMIPFTVVLQQFAQFQRIPLKLKDSKSASSN